MKLIFAFGLSFQLPVALTLMGRVGLISSEQLARNRKFAIVGVFVVAAIITPPDIISQIGLAIPILAALRDLNHRGANRRAPAGRGRGGGGGGRRGRNRHDRDRSRSSHREPAEPITITVRCKPHAHLCV